MVPDLPPLALALEAPGPEMAGAPAHVTPYDPALLDLPTGKSSVAAADGRPPLDPTLSALGSLDAYRQSTQEQAEHSGQRSLPWPIDIFLYPCNMAGLITLAMVIGIPMLIDLTTGLAGPFGIFILIPGAVVNAVLAAYFLWYVGQCVGDSALGGVRAPETIAQAPGIWEMLTQIGRLLACIVVALLPMMIYWLSVREVDVAFWSLLGVAAAVCPMMFLAVTMFDSIAGLNPLLLLVSVLSTFLPYLVLVLALGSMVFLMVSVRVALAESPLLGSAFTIPQRYLILVAAHLVGRFYWRHQEALNWDV